VVEGGVLMEEWLMFVGGVGPVRGGCLREMMGGEGRWLK
jgi:hypothetical protein